MSSGSLAIMQIANLKSTLANNTALDAAEDQRELINKQRDVRAAQQTFERLVDDGNYSQEDREVVAALENSVGMDLDGLEGTTRTVNFWGMSFEVPAGPTGDLETSGDDVDDRDVERAREVKAHVDGIRRSFDNALKDLEAEDRLGNHEIQRLMQIMNQNDTLAANVPKKDDDRANAVIGKI